MIARHHVEEIERVLEGGATGRDSQVADSWKRCVEVHGLDPARADPAHIVTETELREHRMQAERMIASARSGLQSLFRQVARQNYTVLLTDAKGVCVDFFGDPDFEDDLRGAGLFMGANWSEDLAGTSAAGACIVTGEPVTIHQDDHFGNAHTALSCTAAPVYDSLGQLAAVLDISLLQSPSPKSSQNLAMSLVTSSARRVEMANLMAQSRREWVLRFSASPEFLDVDPEAAVTLDGAGRIIGFTRGAEKMFRGDGGSLLGQRLETLLDLSVDDLPDLMRDRPTEDRVVNLRDGGALFGHAIAPQAPRTAGALTRRLRQSGGPLDALAGADPGMQRLLAKAERLAPTEVPLLLCGETGSGKMRLARAVHVAGGARRSLIAVDCAALTPESLPDALGPAGPCRATLLLRRVEELPPAVQPLLTSLLDERPGLRPVATCCTDLALAMQQGRFHTPLFYRLTGATLALPPLRKRQDLGWLLDRLLRRRTQGEKRLSPAARADLTGRVWPGNLHELGRLLDVAVALCDGEVIDLPDLPPPAEQAVAPVAEESLESVLEACGWNMSRAARRLGVNRSTVLRRMRRAGLTPPA
ncbi:sigma-54-dependent Fis family transcriptional regulator [Marinovum algicola]|uniref:sigma-54-dependent Fis family transcriptional regulator n=1 Tax=Marinovum algicola TaxID=42444 RepID=UPI0024BBBF19|nr:sigma-54-dependent Fis family transcriptional regulator [Marinovum algicola]